MSAVEILNRLEGVRETGAGKWIAKCPAHEDRSPSLSIRETDDGTVLLYDFGGCDSLSILQAVGLEFRDLFPRQEIRRVDRHAHGVRRLSAGERLELLEHEVTTAALIISDIIKMKTATEEQWDRLAKAAARIGGAQRGC